MEEIEEYSFMDSDVIGAFPKEDTAGRLYLEIALYDNLGSVHLYPEDIETMARYLMSVGVL